MSKDEPLLSNCPLETAEPSRNYARVPGYKKKYKKKDKKKTRKEKKNEWRRNQYARVRRYKITSTLGLLVRGDPQNEGLRGLQPRALGSKLDNFHAGITSTRLHRLTGAEDFVKDGVCLQSRSFCGDDCLTVRSIHVLKRPRLYSQKSIDSQDFVVFVVFFKITERGHAPPKRLTENHFNPHLYLRHGVSAICDQQSTIAKRLRIDFVANFAAR